VKLTISEHTATMARILKKLQAPFPNRTSRLSNRTVAILFKLGVVICSAQAASRQAIRLNSLENF
jgi:hypothetical protein